MLKKASWSESRSYRSHDMHEPMEFYLQGLSNSTSLDLLLGYFSTSSINLLSLGFATFLHKGGTLRMVANHILSQEDKNVMIAADNGDYDPDIIDLSDIVSLRHSLTEIGSHFFQCIAWLIANKRIQIVLVAPKGTKGITHYKSGIFFDGSDTAGFKASCNFTYSGIALNLEEVEVFLSWENSRSSKLIKSQSKYFDKIFNKEADFVRYISSEDIEVAIQSEFGGKEINELLNQERDLIKEYSAFTKNKSLQKLLIECEETISVLSNTPKFPYLSGPREYQNEAYENWRANDKKGIFAMATGTGKTITALNCLFNQYLESGFYKGVIIVPTISLVNQWVGECRKFNYRNIITISSGTKWTNKLSQLLTTSCLKESSFIIIVTYVSFWRKRFQDYFIKLNNNTVLIADEAHNLGTRSLLKVLPSIHLQHRIGLSATINRKYDTIGNVTIQDFFNSEPPYTYNYSMKRALDTGVLCQYTYTPHKVLLRADEQKEYVEVSKILFKYFNQKTGGYKDCQEVKNLLMKRKRIVHKAANKKEIYKSILKDEFTKRGNLDYTLIYVPEGKNYDLSLIDDVEDEPKIITEYTVIVREIDNFITVKQFTGETKNRDKILSDFENGKINVLTSMKCLDEGVDVPRSELAIFCASTGNPRQFIQRRGRVLRTHADKKYAVIHDLIVLPIFNQENKSIISGLIKSELARVMDFANLSINSHDTFEIFANELRQYEINLYDINNEL